MLLGDVISSKLPDPLALNIFLTHFSQCSLRSKYILMPTNKCSHRPLWRKLLFATDWYHRNTEIQKITTIKIHSYGIQSHWTQVRIIYSCVDIYLCLGNFSYYCLNSYPTNMLQINLDFLFCFCSMISGHRHLHKCFKVFLI